MFIPFKTLCDCADKMGLSWKRRLNPYAVPTIFPKPDSDLPGPSQRYSGAFEKRQRHRVIDS